MIFFSLLRIQKYIGSKLHYLSPFSTLCVCRVSNFQIPNMIQRLYIQAPNRYTFMYTAYVELGWVRIYRGLENRQGSQGHFCQGQSRGVSRKKISPENCQGGDNSSSREGVEVTQGRGTVPLTNLTYIYLDSYC